MVPELDKPGKADLPNNLSPDAVRAALEKIVSSDAFGKAERPARFLRHLVESALRGDLQLLKESVLGVAVFDRTPDWDPREVPVVRQEAARLRKRLARYYETDGQDDEVIIELPVGTYVPVFRRDAVLLQGPAAEAPPVHSRQWIYVAALVFCIAVAAIAWRATHRPMPLSIAVLPFTNTSNDPADEYFVDGMTEDVNDALARLETLRVVGRSAAAVFRKQPRDLGDIARQLRVSHILEATVERTGDSLNVVASLRRSSDGARIWTNTYRRSVADVSAIQADLAEGVRASLGIAAPAPFQQHVPSPEAHEYYLKARFEGDQISNAANDRSQEYYRRAIELDPEYAQAWEGLSAAIWNRANADGEPFNPAEIRKSEQALEKSIKLDPGLMRAHVGLAMFAMRYDFDWNRAERELQTAESLGSNANTEINYASLCLVLGRRKEADEHFQRSRDLDSLSNQAVLNEVQVLIVEGRIAEARDEILKIAVRSPTNERLQIRLNFMKAWTGSGADLEKLRKWTEKYPHAREFLAAAEAHNGHREEALRLLVPLEQEYLERHIAVYGLASIRAALDDEPNTVKLLDQAIDAREDWALYIPVDTAFAKMRNMPEFHRLKERLGLDR
jgi:TolB-like protein/Tfp pilus assembly protein PilF